MTREAITVGIAGGWDKRRALLNPNSATYSIEKTILDPEFWQALGKAKGWGGDLWTVETLLCFHCGVSIKVQPPRETGCNHVHFPEDCQKCWNAARTWRQHKSAYLEMMDNGVENADAYLTALLQ